ncbi:hypothetical protein [Amycolatopsis regifaucium]|uniref:Uncharacterized protein n=1 Tax=Amycolatopsis regifaucium TaxID=546365 RepID=A0A154MCY3_9PSEU|nr:hypothetical protein [Amycolatopsis regifaucium]KZB82411.1 hypothetical protein AVL48_10905 [Amycolatopsis regifaucium]OKA10191.1 hypothetical protein ATP06_0204645 [Amycolatopsis regifaucium]SFG92065.1 hypothetical protein SAMN04489731_101972 [Amycolatopsis regifaucium]
MVPRTAQRRLTDGQLVALQLGSLWLLGTLGAITVGWLVVLAAFLHLPRLALPVPVMSIATAYLTGFAAPNVSPFTVRPWPRLAWAFVVGFSGVFGAIFVVEVAEAFDPVEWVALPFLGLPAATVAALFVADRRVRTGAAILGVALVTGGIAVPAALPEDTAARRLAATGVPHERTLAADLGAQRLPGKATADSGTLILEYGPQLWVSPVWTFVTDAVESCETSVKTNWRLENATCAQVGEGAFVRQNADRIEFIQRRGAVSLHLAGNHNWKPSELQGLAAKTHPLTDAEIMAALPKASGGHRTDVPAGYARFVQAIFPTRFPVHRS